MAPRPIIEPIIEQYAEDGAFLWLLRHRAVRAPHYRLRELARLDERIEAHVDGLRVAGPRGWEIAREGLFRHGEPGEAFLAAVLALESRDAGRLDEVLAIAGTGLERPVVSALGWVEPQRLRGTVAALLRDPRPFRRRLGVAACSVHRVDPGPLLPGLLEEHPEVRARALRLSGEIGRADLMPLLRRALAEDDASCRFWAAWSATLLGDRHDGPAALRGMAAAEGLGWIGFHLVLRAMPRAAAMDWLQGLRAAPLGDRLLVAGAGVLGDPSLVPWLVARMEDSRLARLAGEAFTTITGVELEPVGLAAGPSTDEDPESADAPPPGIADWDDPLPWPDAGKVRDWWTRNAASVPPGERCFLGRPVTPENLRGALAAGSQRQRRAAAVELALARPDEGLVNCSARTNGRRARRDHTASRS